MKKLPLILFLALVSALFTYALLSARRNNLTTNTNSGAEPAKAVPPGFQPEAAKKLANTDFSTPKSVIVKRGKQAIKPEEVLAEQVPQPKAKFTELRDMRPARMGEEYEEKRERERQKRRYAYAGRLPKYGGQAGTTAKAPLQKPPTEQKLTRAGKPFTGDLRSLPQTKPVRKEKPEREGPTARFRFIGETRTQESVKSVTKTNAPAPAPLSSFEGLDFANWGAGHPPDTVGDVGPDYFIQSINSSVGIFRKSDGVRVAAFTLDTFMSQGNFGNLCDTDNFGDPVILYDTFEDRWVISDFAFQLDGGNNVVNPPGAFQCFAVSKNGNPLTGGWNFYSINTAGGLGDYPKLGIWPDGIYMSVNMFDYAASGSFQTARVYALNKAQMYAGAPTVQVVSFNVPEDDFTVLPSNARLQTGTPPVGTPNYFVSTWQFLNGLTVYKFHVDWNKISLSTFTGPDVPLATTSWPNAGVPNAPSQGGNSLDVLQIRAMMQNQYTNLSNVESLWTTHTVRRGNTTGFAAPRWYQVNVTGGTVAANIPQAATWDPDGANVLHRFMPSLALNRLGDLALGYSTSSSTTKPAIKYAGRLASDPINTFSQTEQVLIQGTGTQTGNCGGTCSRWGDYSAMTLAPDGCTFWYTNMYYAVDGLNHQTRIGSFSFPGCTPIGNGTVEGTVSATTGGAPLVGAMVALGNRTTTTNGSGFYQFTNIPAGTYPSITATFPGYNSSTVTSLAVNEGATTTQNFSLGTAAVAACLTDTTQSDFQTGVGTNVDLTTNPGDVTLRDAPFVDQENTTLGTQGAGFNTATWLGQTFTPAVTGQVVSVDMNLFSLNCSAVSMPDITVSIRNASGNLPTGADLATATIAGFCNGGGGYFSGTFATPLTLTAGTQYALVWRAASAIPTGTPIPGYFGTVSAATGATALQNPYAGGRRASSSNSGSTWAGAAGNANNDHGFRIFVKTGFAATGNLVSGLKDANTAIGTTSHWTTLSWTAATPANTELKFQVAGSNSPFGPFNFVGPDSTAGSFFTVSGASLSQFDGLRYLQYKAYLSTSNSAVTPTLNDVTVCFSNITGVVAGGGAICVGGATNVAVTISGGTPPYTVILTNGGGTQTGAGPVLTFSVSPGSDTTYALAAGSVDANTNPIIGSGSATVTVIPFPPMPTIMPGGPTTFCAGGSLTLTSSSATGNQWYLNGSPIGGATNQTYSATTAGSYTVVVTASGCSSAPSAPTVVTTNTPPVLSYNPASVAAGTTPTIAPATGPSDNGTITSIVLQSIAPNNGGLGVNVNNITGQVQVTSATLAGSYTVTIVATDNCNATTTATLAVSVGCPIITISPATLPNGVQGTAYNQSLTASPMGGNYTYALTTNVLPPGLSLNSTTGAITGTPTSAGNYAFVVTVTNSGGCTKTQSYNVIVTGTCGVITLSPASLPATTLNAAYNQSITAAGGTAPYSFNVSSGALPPGLTLDANTGALTGTPTAGGSFTFTIKTTGQGGCFGTRNYVIAVTCATLTFSPAVLPNGTVGQSYHQPLTVTPLGTYTFSLSLGSLPPGFTLNSAGVLSGATNQTGTFNFTVKAVVGTCQGTKAYTLIINASTAALAQKADYDGDGKSDFALWSNNGAWRLLLSKSDNRQAQTQSWGAAGDVSLLGDYDGDGLSDLAVFRPANGTWYVRRSSNGSFLSKAWGTAGDVPVPGDYDGDGQTDLAVFRPSEGNWYVLRSLDQQYEVAAWGSGLAPYLDVPVPGDYDGDGRTDLAVFRRASGTWFVRLSGNGQLLVKQWGLGTDVPVATDYDGDGRTDTAVWRTGVWYILQSATGISRLEHWGTSAAPYFDQATPGDYDGDGQADIAVWRASDQTWYVRCSVDGSVMKQAQGIASDVTVSARPR
jgi:hypothetical protein